MIRIEAGGIGNIDAQISKRKGEMDFCVEARTIDKVRIKNSRDSKNRVARVEIFEMFTDEHYLWIDRIVRKFVLFRNRDEFIDDVFTFEGFERHHLDAFPRTDH